MGSGAFCFKLELFSAKRMRMTATSARVAVPAGRAGRRPSGQQTLAHGPAQGVRRITAGRVLVGKGRPGRLWAPVPA